MCLSKGAHFITSPYWESGVGVHQAAAGLSGQDAREMPGSGCLCSLLCVGKKLQPQHLTARGEVWGTGVGGGALAPTLVGCSGLRALGGEGRDTSWDQPEGGSWSIRVISQGWERGTDSGGRTVGKGRHPGTCRETPDHQHVPFPQPEASGGRGLLPERIKSH